MINRLVQEINSTLDSNLYLIALNTALTLPDICGKAEYPKIKNTTDRYLKWYSEYIGQGLINPDNSQEEEIPYLNATVVYQLRCAMLHAATPNVTVERTKINRFILKTEPKNGFGIYADVSTVYYGSGGKSVESVEYIVSVRRLCFLLCQAATVYYRKNPEKFNFFDYCISDSFTALTNQTEFKKGV